METQTASLSHTTSAPRFCGWVFCDPNAVNGRVIVVQASRDTLVGFTGTGRFIIAQGTVGEVGQQWFDGEFFAEKLEGTAYAFLGESGSARFADEIGATKSHPQDRFEACPDLPHHQFSDKGAVEMFPGLVSALQQALNKGNFFGARRFLGALEEIAKFSRSDAAWHYMDLP